jgi:hypothetical protein
VSINSDGKKHSISASPDVVYKLSGSRGRSGNKDVFGVIKAFIVKGCELPPDQSSYYGPAHLIYIRYPPSIFGTAEHEIASDTTLSFFETHNFSDIVASPDTLRKLQKEGPANLSLVALRNCEKVDPSQHKVKDSITVTKGTTLYKIGAVYMSYRSYMLILIECCCS